MTRTHEALLRTVDAFLDSVRSERDRAEALEGLASNALRLGRAHRERVPAESMETVASLLPLVVGYLRELRDLEAEAEVIRESVPGTKVSALTALLGAVSDLEVRARKAKADTDRLAGLWGQHPAA